MKILSAFAVLISVIASPLFCNAQNKKPERTLQFYFSWGYNTEWFTQSNLKINQPELQNDYTFENIKAHDRPGWNDHILSKPVSIPQYNYRLGFFFNRNKSLGLELNFDHTKFIATDGQLVHIKGVLKGVNVDTVITFSESNGFYYFLNNGANFLLFNLVKHYNLIEQKNSKIKMEALLKAGIGPVIPHVDNRFFGNNNNPHFQLGGWNTGVEAALRIVFFKYVYLEYANKLDYARYSNLKIFEGTAKHAFGTYEMILNLGITFPAGKKKPD